MIQHDRIYGQFGYHTIWRINQYLWTLTYMFIAEQQKQQNTCMNHFYRLFTCISFYGRETGGTFS